MKIFLFSKKIIILPTNRNFLGFLAYKLMFYFSFAENILKEFRFSWVDFQSNEIYLRNKPEKSIFYRFFKLQILKIETDRFKKFF